MLPCQHLLQPSVHHQQQDVMQDLPLHMRPSYRQQPLMLI
jgi:hypothetical protein